jgi:hypothetical protein
MAISALKTRKEKDRGGLDHLLGVELITAARLAVGRHVSGGDSRPAEPGWRYCRQQIF